MACGQLFSFKCFPKDAFVNKIFTKLSGLFWLLKVYRVKVRDMRNICKY